ncbi:MAG TPA: hypothetical protein VNA19_11250, partial [Pyrinomonadaceae bacterium]|nr:hypothetical protein [Pyrinomonadaceae bacterium]
MPITLPNLDDRNYEDLLEEARSLLPTYAPQWTNHNPSDPGITLIELFAYLTEMLLYRLNRVTDANVYAFLRLLNAPGWQPSPEKSLQEHVRETMLTLREPYRAVTCGDFEYLSFKASDEFETVVAASKVKVTGSLDLFMTPAFETLEGLDLLNDTKVEVRRALCVAELNLENDSPATRYNPNSGHISVIIVSSVAEQTQGGAQKKSSLEKETRLLDYVQDYLDQRRLVTTRVHVVRPRYLPVIIQLTLVVTPDALTLKEELIIAPAEQALRTFLDPLTGGHDAQGWPFGRNVYVSEIYELLDRLSGVDYVTRTRVSKNAPLLDELAVAPALNSRVKRNASGEVIAVELLVDELVA